MDTTFNRIVTLGIIVGMIILTATLITQRSYGSVNDASASYEATTTRSHDGTALTSRTLSQGFGTLGSVVVVGTGGAVTFYDATTTSNHSDHATTSIANLPTSLSVGTYTFDIKYTRGLVMVVDSGVGTSTVTWKK